MTHSVSHIGQIAITVRDVETALPFYQHVLGLPLLFRPSPTVAFLQAGEIRIMLSTPQGAGTVAGNSVLYFKVDDIEDMHTSILARGATNERAPQLAAQMADHALWLAFVRDPDGNLIGLMQEKR